MDSTSSGSGEALGPGLSQVMVLETEILVLTQS